MTIGDVELLGVDKILKLTRPNCRYTYIYCTCIFCVHITDTLGYLPLLASYCVLLYYIASHTIASHTHSLLSCCTLVLTRLSFVLVKFLLSDITVHTKFCYVAFIDNVAHKPLTCVIYVTLPSTIWHNVELQFLSPEKAAEILSSKPAVVVSFIVSLRRLWYDNYVYNYIFWQSSIILIILVIVLIT